LPLFEIPWHLGVRKRTKRNKAPGLKDFTSILWSTSCNLTEVGDIFSLSIIAKKGEVDE